MVVHEFVREENFCSDTPAGVSRYRFPSFSDCSEQQNGTEFRTIAPIVSDEGAHD